MIYVTLIIPVIYIALSQLLWRHKISAIEILAPFIPSLIIIPLAITISYGNIIDTERLGDICVKVEYYEDWNEYIHQICTRTVSCGKDCTTVETYDCSYVAYYPPKYIAYGKYGSRINITKNQYLGAKRIFGNSTFVDMRRPYHTNDGDMYKSVWNGKNETFIPLFQNNNYTNKVLVNKGLFDFEEITEEEKKKLYKWPHKHNPLNDPAILGSHPTKPQADKKLQRFNAENGPTRQMRTWILLFKGESPDIAFRQRDYWDGVNKNEFVICIGLDENNDVAWNNNFYWSPDGYAGNHELSISIRDFLTENPKLDLSNLVDFLDNKKYLWKRKKFAEFDYLSVPVSSTLLLVTFIFTIICGGIVTYITYINDVDKDF